MTDYYIERVMPSRGGAARTAPGRVIASSGHGASGLYRKGSYPEAVGLDHHDGACPERRFRGLERVQDQHGALLGAPSRSAQEQDAGLGRARQRQHGGEVGVCGDERAFLGRGRLQTFVVRAEQPRSRT